MSITDDIEDFLSLHRPHGQLVGDATEPTLTGYRVTIECPCGVTFARHVTAGEAMMDLAALARCVRVQAATAFHFAASCSAPRSDSAKIV